MDAFSVEVGMQLKCVLLLPKQSISGKYNFYC